MSLQYRTEIAPPAFSETVKKELDWRFSRRKAVIAPSDSPLPFGLVLAESAGQLVPYAAAKPAAEGEQAQASPEACAILISPLPASESPQMGLVLAGFAVINPAGLVWDASVTDREAALKSLAAKNFVLETVEEAQNAADAD